MSDAALTHGEDPVTDPDLDSGEGVGYGEDDFDEVRRRVAEVVERLSVSGRQRTSTIAEVVHATREIAAENDALRLTLEQVKAEAVDSDRRRAEADRYADELTEQYRQLAESYATLFQAVQTRVHDMLSEDELIDSARSLAFSRAAHGVGGTFDGAAPLPVQEAEPAADREPVRRAEPAAPSDDESAIRDKLLLALNNFGKLPPRPSGRTSA
jgi:phage-related tail protein